MPHNIIVTPRISTFSSRPDNGASITCSVRGIQRLLLLGTFSLWGCTIANLDADSPSADPMTTQTSQKLPLSSEFTPLPGNNPQTTFSLEDRMWLTSDFLKPPTLPPTPLLGPLYAFRSQDLPVIDALALFARSNHLNIVAGPEITGTITVDFHELPLEQAMSAILEAHGYYWEHHQNLIQVKQFKTKTLNVDYIRLVRSGTGQNRAQLSSGSSGGSGGGPQDTGQITVNQEDEIKFWEELEQQIKTLMSEEGRLVVNRLSGTIQISDRYKRVDEIDSYIKSVHEALYRQVEIEMRIYEVALDDQYSLGINWNRINFDGTNGAIALANIITGPFGGFMAKTATTKISFEDGKFDGVLAALEEQGEIRVVSKPRVVTMNNQPALIKVASDEPFFSSTIAQGTAGNGNIVTEQVRSVTVGLVLSVTPQISEDGWIMLDVTPILSRLREIRESPGAKRGEGGATAPVLDVKQSSGLVRMKDGEMVIIGGLIQEESSETERKVPILGDIPYLGRLFKGTYTAKKKSELVIFLSPRIIRASL